MPSLTVYPLNWFRIIVELEKAGLSDTKIAEEVGCDKSRIARYKGGAEPLHVTGEKLRTLHHLHCLSVQPVRQIVQPFFASTLRSD